jgi:branched-chain amino acid transport system substrate-binding protein
VWFLSLLLLFQASGGKPAPYFDFGGAGAGFYGDGRSLPDPEGVVTVKIGVLGPGMGLEGVQQRTAVQLAIDEANSEGGYHSGAGSIPFEMVFHPDDGPWGVAASRVVDFAYQDNVWVIIGGLDGQHTHVAELVVSKAWVPVISPGATDSSIDYANVPWVFRAVPDDRRQADLLLAYARTKGYRRLVVVSEIEREAYTGFRRIMESSREHRFPLSLHLQYSAVSPEQIVPRLQEADADAVLLWGRAETALRLLKALRDAGVRCPVLAPAELAVPQVAAQAENLGELVVASPCDLSRGGDALRNFAATFRERAGAAPSPVALYSYDVARLVIQSIRHAGLNRARIRDALSASSFEGLTGNMSFGSLGGNKSEPVLMSPKSGGWVRLDGPEPEAMRSGVPHSHELDRLH